VAAAEAALLNLETSLATDRFTQHRCHTMGCSAGREPAWLQHEQRFSIEPRGIE
jgi:hypothetical protein